MHNDSAPTIPRSIVQPRCWSLVGQRLSPLRALLLPIASLLFLMAVGSPAAAQPVSPVELTAIHRENGLDYYFLTFGKTYPDGFDLLSWKSPPAYSFTIYRQPYLGNYEAVVTITGNPNGSASYTYALPSQPRTSSNGFIGQRGNYTTYWIAAALTAPYNGLSNINSNKVWCGELLANGNFRNPVSSGVFWNQGSSVPFPPGSFIKGAGDGSFFGQLGGVESSSSCLYTTTLRAVPIVENANPPRYAVTLQLLVKVRCDTTDIPEGVYDYLYCLICDADTGAALHYTPVMSSNLTAGGNWVEFTENLPYEQYVGKKLQLYFIAQNDYALTTTFYFKDLSLHFNATLSH